MAIMIFNYLSTYKNEFKIFKTSMKTMNKQCGDRKFGEEK